MKNTVTGLHEENFTVFMAEINGELRTASWSFNKDEVASWIKSNVTTREINDGLRARIIVVDMTARERQ